MLACMPFRVGDTAAAGTRVVLHIAVAAAVHTGEIKLCIIV
jgi:hypothetical protein